MALGVGDGKDFSLREVTWDIGDGVWEAGVGWMGAESYCSV